VRCPQRTSAAVFRKNSAGDSGRYRSEAHAVFEKNSFALDVCATAAKKIAYFRRVIAAVVGGIESKKDFSDRRQVMLLIAQKEIPFRGSPAFLGRVIKVKVRRERRDPIELLTEVRQRLESVDLINDSLHGEQLQ